ncbi:hypothetical protein ACQGS6_22655 [Bacillus sp. GMs2/2]|uniref:hypothetical protein n=1 Tax=Bacillus sp. GMs2/2 TaxID=3418494 RepID=UPI003CF87413
MKKKVILTTGLAVVLGVTSFGNAGSVFAAEQPSMVQSSQMKIATSPPVNFIESQKQNMQSEGLLTFSSRTNSGFRITERYSNERLIDTAVNDNRGSAYPQTIHSATRSFSTTDSLTLNASVSFSFGQEISASAKLYEFGDISGKFTANQTISAGASVLTSSTRSISYGGDAIEALPRQLKKIEYIYKVNRYAGEMNTGTQITQWGTMLIASPSFNSEETWLRGNGLTGKALYDFFKRIKELNDREEIYFVKKGSDGKYGVILGIPQGQFDRYLFIDDEAESVSTTGNRAAISNGVSGIGLIARTTTEDTEKRAPVKVEEKIIKTLK